MGAFQGIYLHVTTYHRKMWIHRPGCLNWNFNPRSRYYNCFTSEDSYNTRLWIVERITA